jgi:hypothetical protein
LHFIGHCTWRQAAQYGTLTFESSTGGSRALSTQYLADVLGQYAALRLLIVQTVAADKEVFGGTAPVLWERGPSVIVSSALVPQAQGIFNRKLYASLSTGFTLEEATAHARDALATAGVPATLGLKSRTRDARLVEREVAAVGILSVMPAAAPAGAHDPGRLTGDTDISLEAAAAGAAAAGREAARAAIRREVERKRAAGEFDVFLCHNGSDKPAVRDIADRLEASGILPWLDERELPPGQPWQPLLEQQIANIKSAAVFVGAAGVGPWQEQELYGFLREFVSRKNPVIPVLLRDAPDTPELPLFLRAMTWVDFREERPDPLSHLIWGITGKRP